MSDLSQLIFGRLSWASIPLHEPILLATFAGVALGGIAVLALLTKFRLLSPFLNNCSFWLTVGGSVLVMISLFVGEFATTGWLAYPPLSGVLQSPGVGVDYYLWALQVAGVGTTLSGINLIVTIIKMRAPGMK